MKKSYTLNTILAAVLGLALLVCALLRVFVPRLILPELDLPNMVLLSVAALLIEHYFVKPGGRCWLCVGLFSAVCFGLLPFAASFATGLEALKLAALGGVVFTAATWVFDTMADRMSSGPAAKAAPLVSGLCLYLAAQCLMGMI